MNALVAFRINGIHALGHEPGASTLQNRTYRAWVNNE